MSIFHYEELWIALIGVAAALTFGAFLFIIILVRRARWEASRRYFEIHLLINEVEVEVQRLKLSAAPDVAALKDNDWFKYLQRILEIDPETAARLISEPRTRREAIQRLDNIDSGKRQEAESVADVLRNHSSAQKDFNEARSLIGRPTIRFGAARKPASKDQNSPT